MDNSHQHTHGADRAPADHPHAGMETAEHLARHLAEIITPESVIVCVGHDLCGDDGAGTAVAKGLAEADIPWQVFDTQSVPESFLMKIVAARPGGVVLVDALHFGARPGAVELIQTEDLTGQGPSTHGPAPLAFLDILKMMHPCPQAVLGIQPQSVEFGTEITEPVAEAVDMVVRAFQLLAESQASQ